ncbi:MAG: hypothetical protein PWR13_262 [Archaeoglobi archaeon]|nr:universal stress protein [Candidatus Mnemosynella sp.]MBC7114348.1 universal stress protein [Candidatus Mnemosynella bozhongmuii]MDI3501953.1 hypothetical protein [Archaeoglobi archaeon]MDK2781234.1 hypothetical protein [Archaeoglobi archaeon]
MLPKYSKILLPVDGSECSKKAALHAFSIARSYGGEIFAVHVIDIEEEFLTGTYYEELLQKLKERGQKILEEIERMAEEHGIKVQKIIKTGNEAEEILEAAEEVKADLIVMGSHGKSALAKFLIGSVSERVIRHSKIPVLTVRSSE